MPGSHVESYRKEVGAWCLEDRLLRAGERRGIAPFTTVTKLLMRKGKPGLGGGGVFMSSFGCRPQPLMELVVMFCLSLSLVHAFVSVLRFKLPPAFGMTGYFVRLLLPVTFRI